MDGGQLHLLVDGCCVHVKGTAEDIGESDDVVNLVGIVGAACRHENVGTGIHRVLIRYLGYWIGEGEDNGILGHCLYHLL